MSSSLLRSFYPVRVGTTLAFVFATCAAAVSAGPVTSWWLTRGAIDTSKAPADYAAANQGQAKNLAQKAFDELQADLPGGAGPALTQLIASWSDTTNAKDYSAITVGQLKNLAKPFYDRLAESGYSGPPLSAGQIYPWSGSAAAPADYATANIGQLKYLFSFDLGHPSGFFTFLAPLSGDVSSGVNGLSFNGSTVLAVSAGTSSSYLQPPPGETFLWTQAGGDLVLGSLPDTVSTLGMFISADGSVVMGESALPNTSHYPIFSYKQFRWTPADGVVEFIPLAGATNVTLAGLSDDGLTVSGSASVNAQTTAYVWSPSGGGLALGALPGDTFSVAQDLSADGSVVVGQGGGGPQVFHGFRWTAQTGMVDLGFLPGSQENDNLRVSANGQVVIGLSAIATPFSTQAFRWTPQTGMVGLGYLPGHTSSSATAVSADGSVVAGVSDAAASTAPYEAFRWTASTGMVGLGYLPGGGYYGSISGMSRDGKVIVGLSDATTGQQSYVSTASGDISIYTQPFIWTQATGMRSVADVLAAVGADLTGWTIVNVRISPDGTTLAGSAVHASAEGRAWVARLQ